MNEVNEHEKIEEILFMCTDDLMKDECMAVQIEMKSKYEKQKKPKITSINEQGCNTS